MRLHFTRKPLRLDRSCEGIGSLVLLLFSLGRRSGDRSSSGELLVAHLLHTYDIFGVSVDSQTYELLIEVVNGVEVLQEEAAEQEVAIVVAIERVLCDRKLADTVTLVKEAQWFHLKHRIIDAERDGLDFLCH